MPDRTARATHHGSHGLDIDDLGEEHGQRVVRVLGKGTKVVLVPMPPAVAGAVHRAIAARSSGAILLNRNGRRTQRHSAARRRRRLQNVSGVRIARMHPHMLRHTFVTTMLDAEVDLRDTQIAPGTPIQAALRPGPHQSRPAPNYILAAYVSSGGLVPSPAVWRLMGVHDHSYREPEPPYERAVFDARGGPRALRAWQVGAGLQCPPVRCRRVAAVNTKPLTVGSASVDGLRA